MTIDLPAIWAHLPPVPWMAVCGLAAAMAYALWGALRGWRNSLRERHALAAEVARLAAENARLICEGPRDDE